MANTNPRFVSPLGIAQYPYLHKPDIKFNPDGEYKTTLRIKKEDGKEIIQRIDEAITASVNQQKKGNVSKSVKTANPPYKTDENGDYLINFKLKENVEPKLTLLFNLIFVLCPSIICFDIAKPSPVPPLSFDLLFSIL